ncbi:MAG: MFS transporter [Anaeromyxobacter sp.]|nr:MFS transporter [Anaeromyxobacter sp.]MBL0275710.1 MFS transporter [Anaeromyxobacter sp.]
MALAWRLRLLYFLYYGAVGSLLPYLAPYLRGLGFSGTEIGAVQLVGPLVGPVAGLAWAAAADRSGQPGRTLGRATALAFLAAALLPFARTPLQVGAVLLLTALGDRAVVPLLDSLTLEQVRLQPGLTYARVRLGGSLGFAALALLLGGVLAARGDRTADPLVPVTVAVLVGGYALAARGLPAAGPRAWPRPGWPEVRALLSDRRLMGLLAACALHWLACAPFHLFFGLLVRERGLPSVVTGLGMGAGVAAEVAALLWFPRLEGRFRLRTLLAVAFAGSALRWFALARAEGAPAVVALQLLHGLTFGLFWGSAVAALVRLIPAPLRSTGQAVFSAVVFGGGNAFGYQLSGIAYDHFGRVGPIFDLAGLIEMVPLLGVLLPRVLGRMRGRTPRV